MFHTRSNGQSIRDYIPLDLKRMFYKNPAAINASHNGLDPYGFSTEGLVLYLPLWAIQNNVAFQSVDAYKSLCANTTSRWTPSGRDFTSATPDYLEVTCPQCCFTSEDYSIVARVKFDDVSGFREIFIRGLLGTDGYGFVLVSGQVMGSTFQAGASQYSRTPVSFLSADTGYTLGLSRTGNSIRIYADGADETTVVGTHTNPLTNARTAKIGVYDDKTTYPLDGQIQDVLVYNRCLPAVEHLDMHNRLSWRV